MVRIKKVNHYFFKVSQLLHDPKGVDIICAPSFIKIAKSDKDKEVQLAAIEKVTNQNVLGDIITHDSRKEIVMAAFDNKTRFSKIFNLILIMS